MIHQSFIQRAHIDAFLDGLQATFGRPGRLFLVGETTTVFEGWSPWTEQLLFAAEVAPADRPAFDEAVQQVQERLGLDLLEESPADVIPLPDGYMARARPVRDGPLQVYHFDPYSVSLHVIARGDEPDYHLVLAFLEHGWIDLMEMERLLEELLPRFTCETIQQDPAEFRRKYKGLLQMRQAIRPGQLHRPTPV